MFGKKEEEKNKNPTKSELEWLQDEIESYKTSIKATKRLKMKAFKAGKMKAFYVLCGSEKECGYTLKKLEERLNEVKNNGYS